MGPHPPPGAYSAYGRVQITAATGCDAAYSQIILGNVICHISPF